MSESPLPYPEKGPTKKEQIIAFAIELYERGETFPFPGIDPESYARMKAGEKEDPGYTTPIDEIIQRLEQEGMKIVLGKNPQSGNVYVLPSQSNDIEMDSISPGQLQLREGMDARLKSLASLTRR